MPGAASLIDVAERLFDDGFAVNESLCVKARNRNAGCARCVESCAAGCLSFEEGSLVHDSDRCIACAACVAACPTGALSRADVDELSFTERCADACGLLDGTLVIACEGILRRASGLVDMTKVVSVPCLAAVCSESIVEAVQHADARRVVLSHGPCGTCGKCAGNERAIRTADSASSLLHAWGQEMVVRVADALPSKTRKSDCGFDANRRLFFEEMRDSAKSVAKVSLECALDDATGPSGSEPSLRVHVNRYGVLPRTASPRRNRLLTALGALSASAVTASQDRSDGGLSEDVDVEHDAPKDGELVGCGIWARVEIALDACNGCRMCAVFCPTGALFPFHTKKGLVGVKQDVRQCAACGCCQNICPTKALTLLPGARRQDIDHGAIRRFVLPKHPAYREKRTDLRCAHRR